jgi:predicted HicB family RNase H-like nuclease
LRYKSYKYYKIAIVSGETMPKNEKDQFVTSLRINPEVWKDAKVAAIQNDMTLTQLVEEAINCWIKMRAEMEEKSKK